MLGPKCGVLANLFLFGAYFLGNFLMEEKDSTKGFFYYLDLWFFGLSGASVFYF